MTFNTYQNSSAGHITEQCSSGPHFHPGVFSLGGGSGADGAVVILDNTVRTGNRTGTSAAPTWDVTALAIKDMWRGRKAAVKSGAPTRRATGSNGSIILYPAGYNSANSFNVALRSQIKSRPSTKLSKTFTGVLDASLPGPSSASELPPVDCLYITPAGQTERTALVLTNQPVDWQKLADNLSKSQEFQGDEVELGQIDPSVVSDILSKHAGSMQPNTTTIGGMMREEGDTYRFVPA